jgi:two-component system sensor histidine kinase AtoS
MEECCFMTTMSSLSIKKLPIPADYLFWRSHARFIFEHVSAAVIAVDASGCITIFNGEAESTFGLNGQNVVGQTFRSVFPGYAEHEYYLLQTLTTGKEIRDAEHTYCPYTGKEGTFVQNLGLVKGDHGEVSGAIWMRKDVTHERRFQQEVNNAQIQAIVSQIAAATAHEIRNPLTTAKGYIQLAKQQTNQGLDIQEKLEWAVEEIDQINHIITDFLALVHPGADGLQFITFNKLIEDLVQLVENVGNMMSISVATRLDKQVPLCMLDAKLVKQAVLNVIRNAIQAMPHGGSLTISTHYMADLGEVSVSVTDTGEGIRKEDLSRIFSPFFSTRVDGSGLGLTLTNRIVQHHGGRVTVTSEVGEGTSVTLVLPVCQ